MAQSERPPAPYDVLFEPVKIGPLTTKNRFFQVPHCNGMGYRDPSAEAAMRKVKAEGGWGVVCTEQVEIHPTSDITPFIELRIWDEPDLPALARIADAIHEGGALAGIELAHNGMNAPNLYSREAPLGPQHLPVPTFGHHPVQARMMSTADIPDLRRWHRQAVDRSISAGFDLVYVYAAHSLRPHRVLPVAAFNQRADEYGGSAVNRMRLLREIIEDTEVAAAGPPWPAGSRRRGRGGAGLSRADVEEILGELAELPDLWDFARHLGRRLPTSRFGPEAEQEHHVAGSSAHQQAGRRRRPVHVAGHDGAPSQVRGARPHRRGPAVDRRPVPAGEDP